MSTELCSLAQGDLFHVNNITQWTALNEFLVDTLGIYYVCYCIAILLVIFKIIHSYRLHGHVLEWCGGRGTPRSMVIQNSSNLLKCPIHIWLNSQLCFRVIRASGFELKPEAVEFKAGAPSGNPANLCLGLCIFYSYTKMLKCC